MFTQGDKIKITLSVFSINKHRRRHLHLVLKKCGGLDIHIFFYSWKRGVQQSAFKEREIEGEAILSSESGEVIKYITVVIIRRGNKKNNKAGVVGEKMSHTLTQQTLTLMVHWIYLGEISRKKENSRTLVGAINRRCVPDKEQVKRDGPKVHAKGSRQIQPKEQYSGVNQKNKIIKVWEK